MDMEDIMALINGANSDQREIDKCDGNAIVRYWSIGNRAAAAIALKTSVVLDDGTELPIKSGVAFARSAGIPQSSVSRGSTIRKAFATAAAARKAYMAQDKAFAEWVSSLSTGKSNRKGTGKGKGKGKPSVQDIAELAAKLTPKQRAELLIVLKNMK